VPSLPEQEIETVTIPLSFRHATEGSKEESADFVIPTSDPERSRRGAVWRNLLFARALIGFWVAQRFTAAIKPSSYVEEQRFSPALSLSKGPRNPSSNQRKPRQGRPNVAQDSRANRLNWTAVKIDVAT
jgi:hypothetical protein